MSSTLQEPQAAVESTDQHATIEAIDRLMSQILYADLSCLWEVLRPERFDLRDRNDSTIQTQGI